MQNTTYKTHEACVCVRACMCVRACVRACAAGACVVFKIQTIVSCMTDRIVGYAWKCQ